MAMQRKDPLILMTVDFKKAFDKFFINLYLKL